MSDALIDIEIDTVIELNALNVLIDIGCADRYCDVLIDIGCPDRYCGCTD